MTKAATTAAVTLRMAIRRIHMVGAGVGEMAGAIILTSTGTMTGRDIPASVAIIRSSFTAAAQLVMRAAASTAAEEAFMVVAEEATAAVAAIVEDLFSDR